MDQQALMELSERVSRVLAAKNERRWLCVKSMGLVLSVVPDQSEHYWGHVCPKRHGEFTGAMPLPSPVTVHGIKGPLPLLLQSFSGSKTAGHRT